MISLVGLVLLHEMLLLSRGRFTSGLQDIRSGVEV